MTLLERNFDAGGGSWEKRWCVQGVVTPTLNGERFIERTLGSIWSQQSDRISIDHVIVDGGSTDRTLEIAAKYPSRVLKSEDDQGMYDAVNKGLALVEGDIVGYINADDESLRARWRWSRKPSWPTPEVGWVCGKVEYVGPDNEVLGRMQPVPLSLRSYLGIGWSPIHSKRCGRVDGSSISRTVRHRLQELRGLRLVRARHEASASPDPASCPRHVPSAPGPDLAGRFEDGAREPVVLERHGVPGRIAWAMGRALSLRLNASNPAWLVAKKRGRITFTSTE